jgi:hypothetical protein
MMTTTRRKSSQYLPVFHIGVIMPVVFSLT